MRLSSMALQINGSGCSSIYIHFGAGSDIQGPTTGVFLEIGHARIRRTEVRPTCSRRAISALADASAMQSPDLGRVDSRCFGRPRRLPFCRAWAKPARVRSRRISRSNSANTASNPAIARPAGVVRSRASVSETKPTPRCSSSCRVARQIRYRPAPAVQSPHQDYIDLPAAGSLQYLLASFSLAAPDPTSRTCMAMAPAPSGGILAHGVALHRKCLLIVGGNAGVQAGTEHFRRVSVPGQKRYRILPLERPVWRPFRSVTPAWPQSILSGQAAPIILRGRGRGSRASVSR